MGFALWIDDDLAWAQGTHEYRPMGVAVVSSRDLFTAHDFSLRRRPPHRDSPSYQGLFASLGDVNGHLARRRSQGIAGRRKQRKLPTRTVI
jgi:hypothetical protein